MNSDTNWEMSLAKWNIILVFSEVNQIVMRMVKTSMKSRFHEISQREKGGVVKLSNSVNHTYMDIIKNVSAFADLK